MQFLHDQIKRLAVVLFALFMGPAWCFAQVSFEPEVVIVDGPGADISQELQKKATEVIRALNEYQMQDSIKNPYSSFIDEAIISGEDGEYAQRELIQLADSTGMLCKQEVLETRVLTMSDNRYEIRNLIVEVDVKGNEKASKSQELVLDFNEHLVLSGARFAMDKQRYDEILMASNSLQDEFRRKQLISYLERFRTAYNKKDVEYIEQQFSDNALIITGTRVKVAEEQKELGVSEEKKEHYKFIKHSKKEYIERLRNHIFKNNSFINVEFSGINIYHHPEYHEVYGVNLFQQWNSSNYSDEGYLFLMIDYEDENRPLIYVRAWQPETFEGEVIEMDMFELVK